jgi:preprotein translocase subunit SecD
MANRSVLLFVLCIAALLAGGCATAPATKNVSLEMHRAVYSKTDGWTKAAVPGTNQTIYINPQAELTEADVSSAKVMMAQLAPQGTQTQGPAPRQGTSPAAGQRAPGAAAPPPPPVPALSITLTKAGADKLTALTSSSDADLLAIYIDGKLVYAPQIMQKIVTRDVLIAGNFTQSEAQDLADRLNGKAGAQRKP